MPPALRMILRNMERRPWRTALSVAGVAAAVAIVIMGNFFRDAIDHIVDTAVQPGDAQRRDVWTLTEPVDERRPATTRAPARRDGGGAGRACRCGWSTATAASAPDLQGVDTGRQLTRIIDVDRARQCPCPGTAW
jgi:putative ABC transport system permease protein